MSAVVSVLCVVTGAFIVGLVVWDVVATTLTVGGTAGPLTNRSLAATWRALLRLHRRRAGWPRLLGTAGALLLGLTAVIWIVLFWAGWSLIFLGSGAVADADTAVPASLTDVVYFAGMTLSTLGVGDFVASTAGWRIASAVAGFSGLALMTLAITYLLSVTSAVVSRRAVATQLHALGDSAQGIVLGGWDGKGFEPAFVQQLVQLPGQLATVAEQHEAYPVLHYFRSRTASAAAPLAMARLYDALHLLEAGVAQPVRPPASAVQPVRRVVERYVGTAGVDRAKVHEADPPPAPAVDRLVAAGLPLAPETERQGAVGAVAGRRAGLRQLVEDAGWEWDG
ncbi:potassium channel family protein [Blastococcus capsensis]|uniref:potassium channel family protein n=1 Tax=Blastococcus capsensis TaxID=1564163 RepID=UPI002541D69C|nr:potassium channel family protein [Blastococcus capsensis]MDK3257662.1 potassium channel family protein [Blastococcus capsensis]